MRCRVRRFAVAVSVLGMGGLLLSGPGTGCSSFIAESALVSADLCFIFDCQDGAFGGTLDPCAGTDAGNNDFEFQAPLFTDCEFDGP